MNEHCRQIVKCQLFTKFLTGKDEILLIFIVYLMSCFSSLLVVSEFKLWLLLLLGGAVFVCFEFPDYVSACTFLIFSLIGAYLELDMVDS